MPKRLKNILIVTIAGILVIALEVGINILFWPEPQKSVEVKELTYTLDEKI